jgi:hypothetical protein
MGKKSKKHGNRSSANDVFQYAKRAMEKHDFKEALRNAKICFRADPSHEHRQILERAWLARGLQLVRVGLQAEGKAAAQELLSLGVSQPDVQQGVSELLLAVGLFDQAVASGKLSGNAGADPAVMARAADRAVADPAAAPASLPEIREGAARVRSALDALYEGNDDAAFAALGEVPRHSPFADWRLFLRGLAAYYRRDGEAMRANWDRLAADRYAARLSVPLRTLADPAASPAVDAEGFRQAVRVLETDLLGSPAIWCLESLQKSLRQRRWRDALFAYRRSKKDIQTALPGLAQRIDRMLYDLTIRKSERYDLDELIAGLEPPTWDPHWHRARALIAEREDECLMTVESHWIAYLQDLASIGDLKPAELSLAHAMILERLGGDWAKAAEDDDDDDEFDEYDEYEDDFDDDDDDDDETGSDSRDSARKKAVEYLTKAIDLAPGHAPAYRTLAKKHVEWEQEDAAAEVHRRLLTQVPDELDSILYLYHYHRKRQEALVARDYALHAQRLKPTSPDMLKIARDSRLAAARALGIQRRGEEARQELAAISSVGLVPGGFDPEIAVHKAMIELNAGQGASGLKLVDQIVSQSEDDCDLYMALSIEAVRYQLPSDPYGLRQQYWDRWQSCLKKKRSSCAAGQMSARMRELMLEDHELKGETAFLNDYLEAVIKYVTGCSRVRWQLADLLNVCRFLALLIVDQQFRNVRSRYAKFLDSGRKRFPQEPELHVLRGELEMSRGPNCCDRRLARGCFQTTIDLLKHSSHPKSQEFQQLAQHSLRLLGDEEDDPPPRRRSSPARGFDGGRPDFLDLPNSPGGILDMIRRMSASMGVDPKEIIESMMGSLPSEAKKARRNNG